MAGYRWVSFTTDYGLDDGFVAACHGVLARLAPQVRVIDVTHQVPPGDVRRAAALLAQHLPYLPVGVHVAVVDPGVGTQRRAVAVRAPGGVLVGPDNGLLPWAAEALGGAAEAVELTNPQWFPPASYTFHGRDLFAPAAARLAGGVPLAAAGPAADPAGLVQLPEPVVTRGDGWLVAEVLTVDRFGNLQLAAPGGRLSELAAPGGPLAVTGPGGGGSGAGPVGERATVAAAATGAMAVRGRTFADAAPGELVVLVDSANRVAVAANGARADARLGRGPGDLLRIAVPGR